MLWRALPWTWEDVAGEQQAATANALFRGEMSLIEYLARTPPPDVIALKTGSEGLIRQALALGWWIWHVDDRYVVLRSGAAPAAERYAIIVPWENAPVTLANAKRVLEETARARRHCPERMSRASWTASRRSVLTRSPAFFGIKDGATTQHSYPFLLK
jgi:hypothetical protein